MEPILGMLTPTVAVIVLVIALIIFGPGKLPELGKSLGRGIKEFKSATDDEEKKEIEEPKKVIEEPKTEEKPKSE